jgi:hypothetical protein
MTRVLTANPGGTVALNDFSDHLEHDLRVVDTETLASAAPAFARLIANRRMLAHYVEEQLLDWRSGNRDHDYFSHTIVMARRPNFFVRANIWIAPDPLKPAPRKEDPSFGYLYPHDHNFAFLTGGYQGPGYTTVLFEYDEAQVVGLPGEPVAIRPCGRAALPRGAMMLYEPSRDIHYQEHPAELSISINVVVPGQYQEHDQFLFDIERQRIDVALTPSSARGVTMCRLAAAIGDGQTADLLADVARRSGNARVRVEAAAVLGDDELARLCADSDPRVRELASKARIV